MFKLVRNENMKLYRRIRTYILLGIVVLATIVMGLIMRQVDNKNAAQDANWRQQVQTQVSTAKTAVNSPQATAESKSEAKLMLQTGQYELDHNIAPYQTTAWKFADLGTSLDTLAIAFIVVIAGDIVAMEFAQGTIKMLLTQTATRTQILLSKYLASVLFTILTMGVLLVSSFVVGGIFFGFKGVLQPNVYMDAHQHYAYMSMLSFMFVHYGLDTLEALVLMTIAFMISSVFRSSALAITLSIIALFAGSGLVAFLSRYTWDKYILLADINFMQFVQSGPMTGLIKGLTLRFSIVTVIIYMVVMCGLSWLIFKRRDVAA